MTIILIIISLILTSANLWHGIQYTSGEDLDTKCSLNSMKKPEIEQSFCFDQDFKSLFLEANHLLVRSGVQKASQGIVERALKVSKRKNLTDIQLKVLTDVVHYEVNKKRLMMNSVGSDHTEKQQDGIIKLGSDILEKENIARLQSISKEYPVGERLLKDFDKLAQIQMKDVHDNYSHVSAQDNIEMNTFSCKNMAKDFIYKVKIFKNLPQNKEESMKQDSIVLPSLNFKNNNASRCVVSTWYFKTLHNILPSIGTQQFNSSNFSGFVDSRVISLSILRNARNQNLTEPVEINLHHISKLSDLNNLFRNHNEGPLFKRKGVFWKHGNGLHGGWSDVGCDVISQSPIETNFKCNHLTNFAILVTGKLKSKNLSQMEHRALSTISTIGCFFSMIGEAFTLTVYALAKVQSKRRFVLINIVLSLLLAQAIFISGIENARHQRFICGLTASLISYFFLASFCWMLNMAIQLYLLTCKTFNKHLPLLNQVIIGYAIPFLIVSLSLIITQGNGFGTAHFCWLGSENGALWIFIGPVTMIIAANIIITFIVLLRMLHTKLMQDASKFNKIKRLIRALFVLTPSLGLTWIFGIFAVSNGNFAIQIIFAVLNSFQGLFIFLNCCLLDNKVYFAKLINCYIFLIYLFGSYILVDCHHPTSSMSKINFRSEFDFGCNRTFSVEWMDIIVEASS